MTVPLVIASLGQGGILFYGIASVRSSWNDATKACVVKSVSYLSLELVYLYSKFSCCVDNKKTLNLDVEM